jgi:DNA (cytosine-5)-methyltransferase 1
MRKAFGNDPYNQFSDIYPKYKITKPIRLIEMFGGYGTFSLGLKYIGANYESYKLVEWAVKSIRGYKNIHFADDDKDYSEGLSLEDVKTFLFNKGISSNYNEPMTEKQVKALSEISAREIYNNIMATHNLVNIQQVHGEDLEIVDKDKYDYIVSYSFPCQDLSLAGTRQGMNDTSTRSGMLWEVERILHELDVLNSLPQILVMENVPQVHDDINYQDFCKWLVALEDLGYKNYWQDMSATDYGIPQTRIRCFMISILGEYSFEFPNTIPLEKKLRDMLEDSVSENYFLSGKQIEQVINCKYNASSFERRVKNPDDLNPTVTAHYSIDPGCVNFTENEPLYKQVLDDYLDSGEAEEGQVLKTNYISDIVNGNQDLVKSKDVMPTLTTSSESESAVVVNDSLKIKNATKQGYLEAEEGDGVDISGRVKYHRGTVQKDMAQTLTTAGGASVGVVVGTYDYNSSKSFLGAKERFKEGADVVGTILTSHTDGIVIDTSAED